MFTPSDSGADPNLNSDQFSGASGKKEPEQITYQYPLSRYHTGHPVDQALGYKDIATGIKTNLHSTKVGAGEILHGVRAAQAGGL
jgi:hypothetical protein